MKLDSLNLTYWFKYMTIVDVDGEINVSFVLEAIQLKSIIITNNQRTVYPRHPYYIESLVNKIGIYKAIIFFVLCIIMAKL